MTGDVVLMKVGRDAVAGETYKVRLTWTLDEAAMRQRCEPARPLSVGARRHAIEGANAPHREAIGAIERQLSQGRAAPPRRSRT